MPGNARTYSPDELNQYIDSATFWSEHIQLYSDWMQTHSDRYAIGAALIRAAPLSAEYGHSLDELQIAFQAVKSNLPKAGAGARQAVKNFQAVKAKKDGLRPYPRKMQDHWDAERAKAAQVAPQPSGSTRPAGG